MKLIDKNTGKTLYSVLGGENLTLDEAIEWAGAEATEDQTYIILTVVGVVFVEESDSHRPAFGFFRLVVGLVAVSHPVEVFV